MGDSLCEKNKVSYGAIAVSIFCLAAISIVVPILDRKLDMASMEIERRMDAFKVRWLEQNYKIAKSQDIAKV